MSNRLYGVILCALALPAAGAEDPPTRDLRLTDAVGQVTLRTLENPKEAFPIDEEAPLSEGDIIETGPQSRAELTMGGESVFLLQPNARLKLTVLYLRNTQIELLQGAMLAKVKPAEPSEQGIIFKMPTAVVAVRGTEFGMDTKTGESHVAVFDEGHVVVAGAWGHEHVMLDANQETRVLLSAVPKPPYKIVHFKTLRSQMPHVRNRAAYWPKHWKPITAERKNAARQRLSEPHPPKLNGFRHTPPRPQPAIKAKVKKPTHSTAKAKPHRTKPAAKKHAKTTHKKRPPVKE